MLAIAITFSSLFISNSINLKTYLWMKIYITPFPLLYVWFCWGFTKDKYQKAWWHIEQSYHANVGLLLRTCNESSHLEIPSSNVPGLKKTNRICQPSPKIFSNILAVHSGVPGCFLLQASITSQKIESVTQVPHIQNVPFSFLFFAVMPFEIHPSPF